jgi:hypothetical protein
MQVCQREFLVIFPFDLKEKIICQDTWMQYEYRFERINVLTH